MKIRTGFVSNSSSSSFIVFTGGDEEGVSRKLDDMGILWMRLDEDRLLTQLMCDGGGGCYDDLMESGFDCEHYADGSLNGAPYGTDGWFNEDGVYVKGKRG